MSKAIAKITVCCPHCKAHQQEPALAKSTFCRRCSEYFAISAATLADSAPIEVERPAAPVNSWARASTPVAPSAAPVKAVASSPPASPPPAKVAEGSGLFGKIEGILSGKPKVQVARCFECSGWHEVSSTASSTTCKSCGAYIDLQDYKVGGSFSRNIKTRGTLYLSAKGDLSSSKVVCSEATIHGKMRGNLTCAGRVTIRVHGKLFGSVEAGELIVERGAEVAFMRPVHTNTAEVHGRVSAQIVANGQVMISKSGLLDGAVSATCFNVEKGGCFQGELTITPRQSAPVVSEPSIPTPTKETPESNISALLASGEQSPALS